MIISKLRKSILSLTLAAAMTVTAPAAAVTLALPAEVEAASTKSVNMSNVKLDKTSATIVLPVVGSGKYFCEDGFNTASFKFSGSSHSFDQDTDKSNIKVSNSNAKMTVDYELQNGVLKLSSATVGSTNWTINLYGKKFTIKLNVVAVKPDRKSSKTYPVGEIKNYKLLAQKTAGGAFADVESGVTWKSDNTKSVTVEEKTGKVTAVYPGNALITARYGKITWHWIVSVTKAKKMNAVNSGLNLAKGTYSQPKRMSKGYYDCSSLVWRSYSPQGYNFGVASYAPTAADEAKYLVQHKSHLKGDLSSTNIKNRKLRAGDLLFRTGGSNGRYKGIYHVEMIRGYSITGVTAPGECTYTVRYVNRVDGYAVGQSNTFVCRPYL